MTKAVQQHWITRLPRVLFIQIQRAAYDRSTGNVKKISNPVHFDKTIYLDRFMLENKALVETGANGIAGYKAKIKELREGLHRYESFGKDKVDLRSALSATIDYFKVQAKDEMTLVDMSGDDVIISDPRGLTTVEDADKTIAMLEHHLALVKQQTELLHQKLAEHEKKVAEFEGLRKHGYDLHSILMHSGTHEAGHYYSFIYDRAQGKWRRYNDSIVTEVAEEVVLKEAIGDGKSPASAYFLIYVAQHFDSDSDTTPANAPDPDTVPEPKQQPEPKAKGGAETRPLREFGLSESRLLNKADAKVNPTTLDYYSSLLPGDLKMEVFQDNLRLDNEIMELKADSISAQTLVVFEKRHALLMQQRRKEEYGKVYPWWNFAAFVESHSTPLYKWCLLSLIISELTEGQLSLDLMEDNDPLYLRLTKGFMRHCKSHPPSLKLTAAETQQIAGYREAFERGLLEWRLQQHMVRQFTSQNWPEVVATLAHYLSNKQESIQGERRKMQDFLKLTLLRLTSVVSHHVMHKSIKEAILALKLVVQSCTGYVDSEDAHIQHVRGYLTKVFSDTKSLFTAEQLADIEQLLKALAGSIDVPQVKPETSEVTPGFDLIRSCGRCWKRRLETPRWLGRTIRKQIS